MTVIVQGLLGNDTITQGYGVAEGAVAAVTAAGSGGGFWSRILRRRARGKKQVPAKVTNTKAKDLEIAAAALLLLEYE